MDASLGTDSEFTNLTAPGGIVDAVGVFKILNFICTILVRVLHNKQLWPLMAERREAVSRASTAHGSS